MSITYKVTVKKDNDGELYIDLPDKLMKSFDWKVGDELIWEETEVLAEDLTNYTAAYVCRKVDWDRDIKPMLEKLHEYK